MPISIGRNNSSLKAQRQLAATSDRLSRVFERLSSGQRINRASDDAAGLSVAMTLKNDSKIFTQAIRNVNDGVSALNIADQAMGNLSQIVSRQMELAEQAANGIYSTAQRSAMDTEAQALSQEYSRILATTQFNGQKLIDGSTTGITLQAGVGTESALTAKIYETTGSGSVTDAGTTTNYTFNLNDNGDGINSYGYLIADLNSDGKSDLIAMSTSSATLDYASFNLVCVLGSSGGLSASTGVGETYSAPGEYVTANLISARVADSTADGKPDIRVRYSYASEFATILGTEQEQFTNTSSGTTFSMDFSFNDNLAPASDARFTGNTTADFNGDGIADNFVDNGNGYTIRIHNTTQASATDDLTAPAISLTSQANARTALDNLKTLSSEISQARGRIGASMSRIASASSILQSTQTNLVAADGRIRSADIAQESAELTRSTILRNMGAAVLAQANQQPKIALQLLKN